VSWVRNVDLQIIVWNRDLLVGVQTTSNFAQHLIEEAHTFDPMNQIMEIVHYPKKRAHLNTEKFHIHIESVKNNHRNDPQTIHPNAIFDALIKTDRQTIKSYNCPTPSHRL